ncbi:primosomal protein N' [Clostridium thermobutyricum]|uniref:Replication restart protein PriA n=1 Tax=Clostridium thermobutyricum TaxID=29372 RepID=N9WFV5_9CLOT|nr:primosomal protein N' [Clostridium thermobutyricum]ENZ01735.1 primosomal protein N' [Clostridium thermobutyricum]
MELYAEIIINSEAIEIDRPFTYKVKEDMADKIQIGHRVRVSFGSIKGYLQGYVIGLSTEFNGNYKLKSINKILDEEPILRREDILTIDFLRERTLCKYIDAIRLLVPTGITRGVKEKKKTVITLGRELDSTFKEKESYKELYSFIKNNEGLTKSEIKNKGFSTYILNNSIKNGFLKTEEETVYRYNDRIYEKDEEKVLTEEQKNALDIIENTNKKGILLHGVTGSGKTEIYMNLVRKTLDSGKGAIILVPEISLTPQMIERFKSRFGKEVGLYHSRLSEGERFDEWNRVRDGKCKLIIGARSALFLPMNNLGLIIVDEEHESSYKSETNPKYQTREVCEYLSYMYDCKYILGSATPSIESYADALVDKLQLVELKNRVYEKKLPQMNIVDMREELKVKNLSMFSRKLYKEIKLALENKKQIILFLNRKGYSTFISCRSCGYVFKCPKCDISMVYHKEGYLTCNYCGMVKKEVKTCPKCSSKYVKFFGAGTEKVEAEVKKYFKEARILRMDRDTTKNKGSYEEIYNSFKNGEADILIGTQMITKGHDFKNVHLVGIMAADMSANIPDYRAGERTFQLITQVAGRAGRGEKRGVVVVQTYNPENSYIQYAKDGNYKKMFKEELTIRKLMNYPPFGRIVYIKGISKDEEKLNVFMKKLYLEIKKENLENVDILGPSKCIIGKVRDFFRYQIIIKGKIVYKEILNLKENLYKLNKSVYNDIRISIDINPNNLL